MFLKGSGTVTEASSKALMTSPAYLACSGTMKVKANPLFPALPVRPHLWTHHNSKHRYPCMTSMLHGSIFCKCHTVSNPLLVGQYMVHCREYKSNRSGRFLLHVELELAGPTSSNNIVIFSPDYVNDPVTDEDSGGEKNVVMYSLPGSQLRAECKFSNYDQQWDSDDEKPLSNFVKRKPKKIKKFSFSKRIPVRTVKNQQSPASLFSSVFDDAIIDMIVSYSNIYAQQMWEDIFH
nr:unnamed protein product [Callosobruchus chinensis]